MIIYKKFFIVRGCGQDELSPIIAFDKALKQAGLYHCNLVPVSSILAENSREIKFFPKLIQAGEIIFCVMARADGLRNQSTTSAIGYAFCEDKKNGEKYGFVLEHHSKEAMSRKEIETNLKKGLNEMAKIRSVKIMKKNIVYSKLDKIDKKYGCCITVLVYR